MQHNDFLKEDVDEIADKRNKEINNSLRRSGFWMFFVSTGTILANLWIRNFVLLQKELKHQHQVLLRWLLLSINDKTL